MLHLSDFVAWGSASHSPLMSQLNIFEYCKSYVIYNFYIRRRSYFIFWILPPVSKNVLAHWQRLSPYCIKKRKKLTVWSTIRKNCGALMYAFKVAILVQALL